jgi:hypothetical protein
MGVEPCRIFRLDQRNRWAEVAKPKVFEILPSTIDWFEVRLDAASRLLEQLVHGKSTNSGRFPKGLLIPDPMSSSAVAPQCVCLDTFGPDWFDQMFPISAGNTLALIDSAVARRRQLHGLSGRRSGSQCGPNRPARVFHGAVDPDLSDAS